MLHCTAGTQDAYRLPTLCIMLLEETTPWWQRSGKISMIRSHSTRSLTVVQVKPFRKLRKVHNKGRRTRLRDLIRYDMRQMHAAFTGTLPVGSSAESLGHTQVCIQSNPDTSGKCVAKKIPDGTSHKL